MVLFDMDGTLAKFYEKPNYMEKMYEQGFFLNLKPYKLVEYVRQLVLQEQNVGILSACVDTPYCKQEKIKWLNRYIPELAVSSMLFCDVGTNKAEYIHSLSNKYVEESNHLILIDDYSKNLYDWEMYNSIRHIAIKFLNGVNNTKGNNYNYKFRTISQLNHILSKTIGEIRD